MIIEFNNEDKVDIDALSESVGKEIKVIREPHTLTTPEGVQFFGYVIDIVDVKGNEENTVRAKIASHKPTLSTFEKANNQLRDAQTDSLKSQILEALKDEMFLTNLKKGLSIK